MRPQQHWEAPGSVQTQSTRSAAATERNAARLDRLCVCEGPGASLHALSDGESSHEDLSHEDLSLIRTSLPRNRGAAAVHEEYEVRASALLARCKQRWRKEAAAAGPPFNRPCPRNGVIQHNRRCAVTNWCLMRAGVRS